MPLCLHEVNRQEGAASHLAAKIQSGKPVQQVLGRVPLATREAHLHAHHRLVLYEINPENGCESVAYLLARNESIVQIIGFFIIRSP